MGVNSTMRVARYELDRGSKQFVKSIDAATTLRSSGRASGSQGESEVREPQLIIAVELGSGRVGDLPIYEHDDAGEAAEAFIRQHALPRSFVTPLTTLIVEKVAAHLRARKAALAAAPVASELRVPLPSGGTSSLRLTHETLAHPDRAAELFATRHQLPAQHASALASHIAEAGAVLDTTRRQTRGSGQPTRRMDVRRVMHDSATPDESPCCVLQLDVGCGLSIPLTVYPSANPRRVAMQFATKHKLSTDVESKIAQLVTKAQAAAKQTMY